MASMPRRNMLGIAVKWLRVRGGLQEGQVFVTEHQGVDFVGVEAPAGEFYAAVDWGADERLHRLRKERSAEYLVRFDLVTLQRSLQQITAERIAKAGSSCTVFLDLSEGDWLIWRITKVPWE